MQGMALVVLAAGIGRRFGGPKQLEAIGPSGETLMEYSIYDALRGGCSRIVVVVRTETREAFRHGIEARLARKRVPVEFAVQDLDDLPDGRRAPAGRAKPWGTGHAVLACRAALARCGGAFAVVNADDFYGADALAAVTHAGGESDVTLVGFPLRETLPETGTVSRAICKIDDDGRLCEIEEIAAIKRNGHDGRYHTEDGTPRDLSGDTPVSMNLWGFPPQATQRLAERFRAFLHDDGDSIDAEFQLPRAVGDLIRTGQITVRMRFPTGRWCGITHAADRDHTRRHIAALIQAGIYPPFLWG